MGPVAAANYSDQRKLSLRVRTLHWAFVVAAALLGIAVALPSVLSQPTLYRAQATVRFDPTVYPNLVVNGQPTQLLQEQQSNLGGVLERVAYPSLRRYGLAYDYPTAGEIVVGAVAATPELAIGIANAAGEGLARRIYTVEGLPLLRKLLGYQLYSSLAGQPIDRPEDQYLRDLLMAQAVQSVTPQRGSQDLGGLTHAELTALARAIEWQSEQIQVDLHAAERLLRTNLGEEQRAEALERQRGATTARAAIRRLLTYLYDEYNAAATLREPAAAFVAQAASSGEVIRTYSGVKLAIAGLVGTIGGVLTVLIDRQVGILAKLQDLWAYRQLIRNMVARDLKARYKSSMLGYVWSLLNPLLTMLVFWVVFSVLLNNPIPMFPVFLIVALLPWNFAVVSVSSGMRSILDNSNLIKKVYFPREILPITVVLSNLVNYLFALPIMFLVMAAVQWFQLGYLNFSWTFAFLPVIVVIQIIFLIGITLLLSTTAVFLRDTTHIVDILIQLWIFLTPVFFSLEQIVSPTFARIVRWLNPMASLIDFYRDILYGQATNPVPVPGLPALDGVFRTLLTALVVLALGSYVFHRYSGRFGEEI